MLLVPGALRVVDSLKMSVLFCPYLISVTDLTCFATPNRMRVQTWQDLGRNYRVGTVELKCGNEWPGFPRSLTFGDCPESHLKIPAYPKRSSYHQKPNQPQADKNRWVMGDCGIWTSSHWAGRGNCVCPEAERAVENVGSRPSGLTCLSITNRSYRFWKNGIFTYAVGTMACPALWEYMISSGVIHRRISTAWGIQQVPSGCIHDFW